MRKRKSYQFTDKKNSDRAVMALILGIISLASLGTVVFLSYLRGGDARPGYGVSVLLATVYSVTGLLIGLKTLQTRGYYRFFPVLAILLNTAALIGIGLILYVGANLE